MKGVERRDFLIPDYLREGEGKQAESYRILSEYRIFEILKPYNPVLVGTIPIQIDVEGSDLDIICQVEDFSEFRVLVAESFGEYDDFKISYSDDPLMVVNFFIDNMELEIFATPHPYHQNNAYRHMLVEDRVLRLLGNVFRDEIIRLKKSGVKTEPAFAYLLGLQEDPYISLLEIESLSDQQIISMFSMEK